MTSAQRRLLAKLVAWYDDRKTDAPSWDTRAKGATLSPTPTADCLRRLGFVEIVGVAFPFRARYAPTAAGRVALQDGGYP